MAPAQKTPIAAIQRIQGLVETAADLWNLGKFLLGQGKQITLERLARVNLVLDAVQPGHQEYRVSQVGIGSRVWKPYLYVAGLLA